MRMILNEKEKFSCLEETNWYSISLEDIVLNSCSPNDILVEFGMGDATPVIQAIKKSSFNGVIYGYEINEKVFEEAVENINSSGLSCHYKPILKSFFEETNKPESNILISNPPYIPAEDKDILLPHLYGGKNGNELSMRLLREGYNIVFMLIASYGNPIELIRYAHDCGYIVSSFIVTPMTFGYYSSEKKVFERISKMRTKGQAFFSGTRYLIASVVFSKNRTRDNLHDELCKVISCLK